MGRCYHLSKTVTEDLANEIIKELTERGDVKHARISADGRYLHVDTIDGEFSVVMYSDTKERLKPKRAEKFSFQQFADLVHNKAWLYMTAIAVCTNFFILSIISCEQCSAWVQRVVSFRSACCSVIGFLYFEL